MSEIVVHQQEHGYLQGHQLLSSSLKLSREDQDLVDRLSDISGQLRPDETFAPYLTGYPLPSRSHYVLARTWQDLEVARAGCVLTRSLFVAIDVWSELPSIQPLLALLRPVDRGERALCLSISDGEASPPTPVAEPYTIELTEALFLETRMPTVVMDVSRAEAAAVRVFTAIWPRLRREFAVCTYALAPRKIGGRDFDLLFAPKSARMRFAGWQGRRIESGKTAPRHRWSLSTAQQIFTSSDPRLSMIDSLGMLDQRGDGDEGNLRLVLLWNELSAKAFDTPSAVLGLLDIANSQGERGGSARESLIPVAVRALSVSRETSPPLEAWRFANTLFGKFSGEVPASLEHAAEAMARDLARHEPAVSLQFLQSEAIPERDGPLALVTGAADGLSAAQNLGALAENVATLLPSQLLRMLALSPGLAERMIELAKHDPTSWVELIARSLHSDDPTLTMAAVDNLLPVIDDESLAPIVDAMVADVSPGRFGDICRAIGQTTGFDEPTLAGILVSAADTSERRLHFRDAVSDASKSERADGLLLDTLRLDQESVEWLATARLAPARSARLAVSVLGARSDREIASFAANLAGQTHLVTILSGDLSSSADALARVVMLSRMSLQEALSWFDKTEALVTPKLLQWMSALLLERSFAEGVQPVGRLHRLLALAGATVDGASLIRQALANGTPSDRWAANLVALNTAPPVVRRKIVERIDLLSERLARGASYDLGRGAYEAWADLLDDAEKLHTSAHINAAVLCLDFALGHRGFPVEALAEAAFPPVHARLPTSRSTPTATLFGAMVAMSLAMFGEIDRAKSARRAFVDAFMHSDWAPSRLVLAGLKARVDQKLLKLVSKEYRGAEYLRRIDQDADRLPGKQAERVRASLRKFAESDSWHIDD